jgi:hypothetical protein
MTTTERTVDRPSSGTAGRGALHVTLWILQALLAALFLFAGVTKFLMPIAQLEQQSSLSGVFLRFIATVEILGALGLVLPSLLRIRPGLTPLAAAGLTLVMIGATVTTIQTGPVPLAVIPLVTGLLTAFVAYGRWRLAPLRSRADGAVAVSSPAARS